MPCASQTPVEPNQPVDPLYYACSFTFHHCNPCQTYLTLPMNETPTTSCISNPTAQQPLPIPSHNQHSVNLNDCDPKRSPPRCGGDLMGLSKLLMSAKQMCHKDAKDEGKCQMW